MKGDTGPYINDDGDVWVPRTVPYLEARSIAKSGGYEEDRDRLVYIGKSQSSLLGFARDCRCDEVCELEMYCAACDHDHEAMSPCYRDNEGCTCVTFDPGNDGCCKVAAWHFRLEEKW